MRKLWFLKNLEHAKISKYVLSPDHCGSLCDIKTSKFFSQSFSRSNFEKLIRTLFLYISFDKLRF